MSVSLAPNWAEHFHKNNSELASGWKVFVYESRTQDYKVSYSDPNGTQLHEQPIILNSRGEFPGMGLYLVDGEAYTLELRNENNVPIKTVDEVYATGGSGGDAHITLPSHTVYGNVTAGTREGYPVTIENSIENASSDDNIPDVGAIKDLIDGYLPNSGDNTYSGNLTITQTVTAANVDATTIDGDTININGTDINDIFVHVDGHDGRSLVGNKDTGTGAVEDIAIANDLSSNSTDIIPSVKAVVDGISDAIGNLPAQDAFTVKTTSSDTNPGYLDAKLQAGDGIIITNDGDVVTIATSTDIEPPASFNSSTSSAVLWNRRCPDVTGQYSPFKYWWTTSNSSQLEQDPVSCPEWDQTNKIFTATKAGRWHFTGSRSGSETNPSPEQVSLYALVRRTTMASGDIYPCSNDGSVSVVLDLRVGDQVYFAVRSPDGTETQPTTFGTYTFTGHSLEVAAGGSSGYDPIRVVYVSNNGNDINDGLTPWNAVATFSTAYNKAKALQYAEGDVNIWTVVCNDTSIFTEANMSVSPSISVYAPLASINATNTFAIPESTSFIAKHISADHAYTYNTDRTDPTYIQIETVEISSPNTYGFITTGSNSHSIDFKFGTVKLTASDWNMSGGILGSVSGGSNKNVNIQVDNFIYEGTATLPDSTMCGIFWNSSNAYVTGYVKNINAPTIPLVAGVGGSHTYISVDYANVLNLVRAASTGTNIGVKGGLLGGTLGYYANTPVIDISGIIVTDTNFINLNADPETTYGTINISSVGKITIKGSDLPAHLRDKIVAGEGITIEEIDDTLVISSNSGTSGSGTATHLTRWVTDTELGDSKLVEDEHGNIEQNAYGDLASFEEDTYYNRSYGNNNVIKGTPTNLSTNNTVHGSANTLNEGSHDNEVIGSGNTVSSASYIAAGNFVAGDYNNISGGSNDTGVIGNHNTMGASSSQAKVIGNYNNIQGPDNQVLGNNNSLPGGYGERTVIGNDNTVNCPEGMAFGTDNTETGNGGDTHMFGHGNTVTGGSGNDVFGNGNHITNVYGSSVFGNDITFDGSTENHYAEVHLGAGNHLPIQIHGKWVDANGTYASEGQTIEFDANGEAIIVDAIESDTYKVATTSDDTSPDYLGNKIVNTDGDIEVSVNGTEQVEINLAPNIDIVSIQMDLAPEVAISEGTIAWNETEHTLNVGVSNNVTLQVGQEFLLHVHNESGATITNGSVVYISSGDPDGKLHVSIASNDSDNAYSTIAVATEDIPNNSEGYITKIGKLRGLNTSQFTEGSKLYLGINGSIMGTEPVFPAHNVEIGYCVYQHATDGVIFVDITKQFAVEDIYNVEITNPSAGDSFIYENNQWINRNFGNITKELTGFKEPENVIVTYDSTTRKITLTGSVEAYWRSNKIDSLYSGWVSPEIPTINRNNFLYYNGTDFVWSSTPWSFSDLQIAFVAYDASNNYVLALRETHGGMPWTVHEEFHQTIGCYLKSGGDLSGYVLNSTTTADRRPAISATIVKDEDLETTNASQSAGTYMQAKLTGANTRVYTSASDIIQVSGSIPYYNYYNGSTWSDVLFDNNNFGVIFVVAIPVTSDATAQAKRYIYIQPQTQYASQALAELATPSGLNLGDTATLAPEFVFIDKIIIRYQSGNWFIVKVEKLTGTKISQVATSGNYLSSVSHDSTLTGAGTVSDPLSVEFDGYEHTYTGIVTTELPLFELSGEIGDALGSYFVTIDFVNEGYHSVSFVLNHSGGGNYMYAHVATLSSSFGALELEGKYTDVSTTRTYKIAWISEWDVGDYRVRVRSVGKGQPEVSTISSYTGTDVTVYIQTSEIDYTKFPYIPQTSSPTYAEGTTYYNDARHNLVVMGENSNVSLDVGRTQLIRAYNNTGTTLTKGTPVVILYGATESGEVVAQVDFANATNKTFCTMVGVAVETVSAGAYLEVCMSGVLRNIDTSSFSNGSILYLSTSDGVLTTTAPAFPNYECKVARVLSVSSTTGVIYVDADEDPPVGSGGAVQLGIQTFPLSQINNTYNNTVDSSHALYLSTIIIPTANMTVNSLSCFVTQIGTNYGTRMGIYSPGSTDTLLGQTVYKSSDFVVGINTLTMESPVSLMANTPYLLAIQSSSNGTIFGYQNDGITTNRPNHLGAYDGWNPANPSAGMESPSGRTQTGYRIWISAS